MPFKGPGPMWKQKPPENPKQLKNKSWIPHFFYRNSEDYGFVIHLFSAYHKILIHRCDLYKTTQISHNSRMLTNSIINQFSLAEYVFILAPSKVVSNVNLFWCILEKTVLKKINIKKSYQWLITSGLGNFGSCWENV